MPIPRSQDPARNDAPLRDRLPSVAEEDRRRNGLPQPTRYTYAGSGRDELTAWMDHDGLPVAPMRLLSRQARLDVCEAIDGPGPEWYRERALGEDL